MTEDELDAMMMQHLGKNYRFYRLNDEREPVECDWKTWNQHLGNNMRHVAVTDVGGRLVSTIFWGLVHAELGDRERMFETKVFEDGANFRKVVGGDYYATWDEAVAGHARLVDQLRAGTFEAGNNLTPLEAISAAIEASQKEGEGEGGEAPGS